MRECIITGKVSSIDVKTSKAGTTYSVVIVIDTDGTPVEIFAGSKVELPSLGSTILCKGIIRTNVREYQGKTYLSFSFWASKFETLLEKNSENIAEESLPEVNYLDEKIPF